MENSVIVPKYIAVAGWTALAAAAGRHIQRMSLHDPITDVDDVDILFHDDVAGKRAIIHPISKAQLDRRGVWSRRAIEISGQIVGFAADDPAQRAVVNSLYHLYKWRTIADLKAYIQA